MCNGWIRKYIKEWKSGEQNNWEENVVVVYNIAIEYLNQDLFWSSRWVLNVGNEC